MVIGGSYGIGPATALAFAAQGATVVIADWEDGSETLDLIKKKEVRVFLYHATFP